MKNALVFSQLEAREFFMYIITLVSCSLLGFSSLRWLGMHLVLFQGSLSLDYYVSISRTSTILFFGVLRQYLAHFQDSLSLDCYVSFARTFSVLLHSKVTLISRAFQNRLTFDCYVSFSRTLGFSFIGLLRQCLAHLQDSHSLVCYVSIVRTFRIVLHEIVSQYHVQFMIIFHS